MPTTPVRRRHRLLALAAVPLLALAACSGDEPEAATPPPTALVNVPDVVDEVCDDPVGDLSTQAVVEGTLTEPAGIDIVRGEVHLDASTMEVVLTTNGDLAAVPRPQVSLFQGPPGQLSSWELRMAPTDDGAWTTTLITYVPGSGRILVDEADEALPVAPTVEGSTLTLELPRAAVPPPLTLAWVFGTSSEVPAAEAGAPSTTQDPTAVTVERGPANETTFDECNRLFGDALDGSSDTSTTTTP